VETYERVLEALSDTTRRRILTRLRERPCSVAEIAGGLPVSRPAVSQHLKVLRDCGLVAFEPMGTRNLYRVEASGVRELRAWLDTFWDTALASYARFVRDQEQGRPSTRPRRDGPDTTATNEE
jgi:DNA-binding transcriptional ArsR family regulator